MQKKGVFCLSFPVGVKVSGFGIVTGNGGSFGRKKQITQLTPAAARRLLEFLMMFEVPGAVLLNASLTIPEEVSPGFFRASCVRFRMSLNYHKIPGVWRVELQRRKTPHLHCFFWIPLQGAALKASGGPEIPPEVRRYVRRQQKLIKALWLQSIQTDHPWAVKYAFKAKVGGVVPDIKWILYNCLHNSKSKQDQLGWQGKQWGVWCRSMFKPVEPVVYELQPAQVYALVRLVNRWLKSKRKGKGRKKFCKVSVVGSFSRIGLTPAAAARLIEFVKA